VHRIGRTGRAGASGLAMTLVTREDARLVSDIEKLIKKKVELEPLELDEGRPPRDERRRYREPAAQEEAAPVRAPRPQPAARASRDPFFDKPYEPSASDEPPAWESAKVSAPATGRGLSPNIKTKKKVAALFGGKPPSSST